MSAGYQRGFLPFRDIRGLSAGDGACPKKKHLGRSEHNADVSAGHTTFRHAGVIRDNLTQVVIQRLPDHPNVTTIHKCNAHPSRILQDQHINLNRGPRLPTENSTA